MIIIIIKNNNNKEKLSKPEQVSLFPPFYKNIHLPS